MHVYIYKQIVNININIGSQFVKRKEKEKERIIKITGSNMRANHICRLTIPSKSLKTIILKKMWSPLQRVRKVIPFN